MMMLRIFFFLGILSIFFFLVVFEEKSLKVLLTTSADNVQQRQASLGIRINQHASLDS